MAEIIFMFYLSNICVGKGKVHNTTWKKKKEQAYTISPAREVKLPEVSPN